MSDSPRGPRASGALHRAAPWIVLLVAIATFANAARNQLVYDAKFLVSFNDTFAQAERQDSAIAKVGALTQVFREEFWEAVNRSRPKAMALEGQALYRPLMMFSLGLVRLGFGSDGLPFNLLNLLFHALSSLLVFELARRLVRHPMAALAAGLLFAVHPLHSEAVAYVAGLGETQSVFFGLAAVVLYLRSADSARVSIPGVIGSALLFALSVFTKESGALTLLLLLFADVARGERAPPLKTRVLAVLLFAAVIGANVAVRYAVIGQLAPDPRLIFRLDNPLVNQSFAVRLATGAMLYTLALRLFLFPATLSADYSFNQLPVAHGLGDPAALVALAICAVLTLVGVITLRRRPGLGFGLLVFLFAFGPASNILFPIGTIFGERLLYLPSVGLCIAAGALAVDLLTRLRAMNEIAGRVANAVAIAVILGLGARAAAHNQAFASNDALYDSMVETAPDSARAWFQRGEAERSKPKKQRRLRAAINDFREAIRILPEFLLARLQLGVALADDGAQKESLETLYELRAMVGNSEALRLWRNLVDLTIDEVARGGRSPGQTSGGLTLDQIIGMQEEELRARPDDPGVALRLVPLYAEAGRYNDAHRLLANSKLAEADPLRLDSLEFMLAAKEQRIDDARKLLAKLRPALEGKDPDEFKDVLGLVRFYGAILAFEDGKQARLRGEADRAKELFEGAVKDLDAYVADNPEDWQAYRWRGEVQHRGLEDLNLAFADYQRSLQLNNAQNDLFIFMLQCLNGMRRFDAQTLRFSEECEKIFPDDAGVKMLRAQVLSAMDQHQAAAEKCAQALELGLTGTLVFSTLARELSLAGRLEEAMKALDQGLKVVPHPDLYNSYGAILFDADQFESALARFEQGLQLALSKPEFESYAYTLRFQVAKTKLHLAGREAEGLGELQALLDVQDTASTPKIRDQRRAFVLRWLGWARVHVDALKDLAKAKDLLKDAESVARKAEVETADLAEILMDLADAQEAAGDRAGALQTLENARKEAGASDELDARIEALKKQG